MTVRDELVVALAGRYVMGSRADQGRILDDFVALTDHHRKHAMWMRCTDQVLDMIILPEQSLTIHESNAGDRAPACGS